jgi:hypothetical protein
LSRHKYSQTRTILQISDGLRATEHYTSCVPSYVRAEVCLPKEQWNQKVHCKLPGPRRCGPSKNTKERMYADELNLVGVVAPSPRASPEKATEMSVESPLDDLSDQACKSPQINSHESQIMAQTTQQPGSYEVGRCGQTRKQLREPGSLGQHTLKRLEDVSCISRPDSARRKY